MSTPTGSTGETELGSVHFEVKEDTRANGEAGSDGDSSSQSHLKGAKLILLHLALCLSSFLTGLDFNMIATAIPVITSEFQSIDDVGWYGAAFYIALWCFYLNLPVGGFCAILILTFLRLEPASTQKLALLQKIKGLDVLGFTLFSSSVAMLLLALQWGGSTFAWKSSVIIGLFIGFGAVMIVFVGWQVYFKEHALIPVEVLANRNVALICISAVFSNGPFQVIIYWLPIWFQAILAATPTSSGVRYLPTVVSDVLTSFVGTTLVTKLGVWKPFLLAGTACVSLGAGLLTTLYPSISPGHWIGYQIFGGIGFSLIINMAHMGVQASLPQELIPIGATTLLFVMSATCAVFLAVGQAVFDGRLAHNLDGVVPSDLVDQLLSIGATQVQQVTSPARIGAVLQAYSRAITQVFYIPAVGAVISFFAICATRWTSLKEHKPMAQLEEKEEPATSI